MSDYTDWPDATLKSERLKIVVEVNRNQLVTWLQSESDEQVISMARNLLEKGGWCEFCTARKARI